MPLSVVASHLAGYHTGVSVEVNRASVGFLNPVRSVAGIFPLWGVETGPTFSAVCEETGSASLPIIGYCYRPLISIKPVNCVRDRLGHSPRCLQPATIRASSLSIISVGVSASGFDVC